MKELYAASLAATFIIGALLGGYLKAKEVCMSACDTKYAWYEDGRCICAEEKE